MPLYRCTGCLFSTASLSLWIEHIASHLVEAKATDEGEGEGEEQDEETVSEKTVDSGRN